MTASGDRNWAQLPWDMLGCIAELLSVSDYFRFGSVCTSWASVAPVADGLILPCSPQKPYLLHLSEGDGILVSFPDHNQHRITGVVDFQGKWLVGSQYGWLALLDERSEIILFNPLTREQVCLPSVTTVPLLTPIYDSDQMWGYHHSDTGREGTEYCFYDYTFKEFRILSFKKVVLSSRPAGGGGERGFTAMAIFSAYTKPAIARPGDDKWIIMYDWPSIIDIVYRNGKFLGVSDRGNLLAFDVNGPSLEVTKIAQGWDCQVCGIDKYLVDSAGDLLMVWIKRESCDDTCTTTTTTVSVMKFSEEEEGTWLPLKSLGDNSLFIGLCCSISLSVREIPELRPNCVYYTEQLWDWLTEEQEEIRMPREVFVFNLEDQTFDRYAPTDHRLYWPPPIWITPSLL